MVDQVLHQNAICVVSDDPVLAAAADSLWVDDPSQTVGERLRRMDDLCVTVLRDHDYNVGELK